MSMSYFIVSCSIISCHVMSCHIILCHFVSHSKKPFFWWSNPLGTSICSTSSRLNLSPLERQIGLNTPAPTGGHTCNMTCRGYFFGQWLPTNMLVAMENGPFIDDLPIEAVVWCCMLPSPKLWGYLHMFLKADRPVLLLVVCRQWYIFSCPWVCMQLKHLHVHYAQHVQAYSLCDCTCICIVHICTWLYMYTSRYMSMVCSTIDIS